MHFGWTAERKQQMTSLAQLHCVLQAQGGEVIEDWEVWGDPREVERRKVERKRAAQPLPVRQAQVINHCP